MVTRIRGSAPEKPPGAPDGGDPLREGEVVTRTRQKVARPPRFKVILFNDDYTPMEFVVGILEQIFEKSPAEATQIMLHVHHNGAGLAGVYVLEVAETKVSNVHKAAEEWGYPLRSGVEPE
jgi:ATP-dependent Clp protease adaptor protein ClpS